MLMLHICGNSFYPVDLAFGHDVWLFSNYRTAQHRPPGYKYNIQFGTITHTLMAQQYLMPTYSGTSRIVQSNGIF